MTKTRPVMVVAAAGVALVALAGCGEQPKVVVYEKGKYQGKADTKPYDNPAFASDKAKWEAAIKSRSLNQNEYGRISG